MKKFLKDLVTGLLASLLSAALVAFIGIKIILPKIRVENVDFESLIGSLIAFIFVVLMFGFFWFALYMKFKLLDQQDKETAEITKLQIKEDAEIEKLKLQKEIEELKKVNQQLSVKDSKN